LNELNAVFTAPDHAGSTLPHTASQLRRVTSSGPTPNSTIDTHQLQGRKAMP
jgi:hypothetical protein